MDFQIKISELDNYEAIESIAYAVILKMYEDGLASKYNTLQDCLNDKELLRLVVSNIHYGIISVHISDSDISY